MILLDTHVLVWHALSPERISPRAQAAIIQANQEDGIMVCDISLWEIAMLIQKGRIQIETDSLTFINLILQASKIVVQPISPQIATLSAQLPAPINQDPADRLIAATSIIERIPLVTADRNLQTAHQLSILW